MNAKRMTRALIAAAAIMAGAACYDDPLGVGVAREGDRAAEASPSAAQQPGAPSGAVVTYTAADFADALRAVGNENEVLVWLKPASAPRPDSSLFRRQGSEVSVVGLPNSNPGGAWRASLIVNRATANAAKTTVGQSLAPHGASPYRVASVMPAMAVRLPDDNLEAALSELFSHDNVDWIEANQRRAATPTAAPVGDNPVGSTTWRTSSRAPGTTPAVPAPGSASSTPAWPETRRHPSIIPTCRRIRWAAGSLRWDSWTTAAPATTTRRPAVCAWPTTTRVTVPE